MIDAPVGNLPKAHTCFNRLDVPKYPSYEVGAQVDGRGSAQQFVILSGIRHLIE